MRYVGKYNLSIVSGQKVRDNIYSWKHTMKQDYYAENHIRTLVNYNVMPQAAERIQLCSCFV